MRRIYAVVAIALATLLIVAFAASPAARADFGDFDTGGDYGGTGGGGGSYDSDNDHDYGSRDRSSASSTGGGKLVSFIGFLMVAFLPLSFIVIFVFPLCKEKLQRLYYHATMRDLKALEKSDPGFDWVAMETWVRDLYKRMQAEWERGDIASLKAEFTPECWNRFDRQLQRKNADGYHGRVRDIHYRAVKLSGWRRRGGTICLDVILKTSIISWNTDRNGRISTGNTKDHKDMSYLWRMQRPADARTDPEPRPCPQCGRPNRRVLAHCPGCGAALERDPREWVLCDISVLPDYMR